MTNNIKWDRLRELQNKNKHGIDLALDARLTLDQSSAQYWDHGGDWWANRIYMADQWIDIIDTRISQLNKRELGQVIAIWQHDKNKSSRKNRKRPTTLDSWLVKYTIKVKELQIKWRILKKTILFSETSQDKINQGKKDFLSIYKQSLDLIYGPENQF